MFRIEMGAFPALVLGAALIAASPSALGVAQRTFVASYGKTTNIAFNCSVVLPCRAFSEAMGITLSGGEVIVLDSAGYGPVTIAQSVSIIAPPGVYAGISVSSGDGITVNGAGITVVLQGLTINGIGGNNGIDFSQGAELHVVKCSIANMSSVGISASAPGGRLFVSDTTIRDNTLFGMLISGSVTAIVDQSRGENNGAAGISALAGASVSVRESLFANNAGGGIFASAASGATTRMTMDDTVLADNPASGASASAQDAGSRVTLDMIRSTSTRNSGGSGATVSATAPAFAVMTVASSVLSENSGYGIFAIDNSTALANGNTISRNILGGLTSFGGALLHTRSNNSGEQSFPISGTTPVAGF